MSVAAPPWQGPPPGELGVSVAERLVLAHTAEIVVAVLGFTVFLGGVLFDVEAVARSGDLPDQHALRHRVELDRSLHLALEVEFADGRTTRDLDFLRLIRSGCADDAPAGALLWDRGGASGAGRAHLRWWLWPLPPPGPVRFRVSWPAYGVESGEAELDAGRLLEVVPHVRVVWAG